LYPDALVAQILAASTYPTQVVEADRWLQTNSNLNGDNLAAEVDKQSWDPSVKALTQFPTVLDNMNTNLSWTSALGDAYFNQQQDVLSAIQVLRRRAQNAGTLKDTPQQTVTTQDQSIIIEPSEPEVVYVPTYDPWLVYGPPIPIYPGYYYGGPLVYPYFSFGRGIGIGLGLGFGWGWHSWDFDWRHHDVVFNHAPFTSHSHTFFHLHPFIGGPSLPAAGRFGPSGLGVPDGDGFNHGRDGFPGNGHQRAIRGFGEPHADTGNRSGAFSGFGEGGEVHAFSSRGQSSFGGGHGFGFGGGHGFGGGIRGGGGGRHR
jgi:Protein of unknown function (DUF3300)